MNFTRLDRLFSFLVLFIFHSLLLHFWFLVLYRLTIFIQVQSFLRILRQLRLHKKLLIGLVVDRKKKKKKKSSDGQANDLVCYLCGKKKNQNQVFQVAPLL